MGFSLAVMSPLMKALDKVVLPTLCKTLTLQIVPLHYVQHSETLCLASAHWNRETPFSWQCTQSVARLTRGCRR